MEANAWCECSPCTDGDILFSTVVMIVGMGEACTMGELKTAYRSWGVELKHWDRDRVY